MSEESTPMPHLASEFLLWLWYSSEHEEGSIIVNDGKINFWLEDRISFRSPASDQMRAVIVGTNVSNSLEARAALAAGKVIEELRLHIEREEREYTVNLRGAHLDLCGIKFPAHSGDGFEGLLYERIYLYEDVLFCISELYNTFADVRTSERWTSEVLHTLRTWIHGEASEQA